MYVHTESLHVRAVCTRTLVDVLQRLTIGLRAVRVVGRSVPPPRYREAESPRAPRYRGGTDLPIRTQLLNAYKVFW